MHILLYAIAVTSTLISLAVGIFADQGGIQFISNGLLAGVLFGAIAKVIHVLVQIEQRLATMAEATTNTTTQD